MWCLKMAQLKLISYQFLRGLQIGYPNSTACTHDLFALQTSNLIFPGAV